MTTSNDDQCRAVKRDGERCEYKAKIGGFCGVHYPKDNRVQPRATGTGKKVARILEVAAATGGAIALIEKIVELWQSLPFGPGPRMPADYTYLADKVGPFYPSMPRKYTPFNKGPNSVNWYEARRIYDLARSVHAAVEPRNSESLHTESVVEELDRLLIKLLNTMQEPLQAMLYEKLGAEADPE